MIGNTLVYDGIYIYFIAEMLFMNIFLLFIVCFHMLYYNDLLLLQWDLFIFKYVVYVTNHMSYQFLNNGKLSKGIFVEHICACIEHAEMSSDDSVIMFFCMNNLSLTLQSNSYLTPLQPYILITLRQYSMHFILLGCRILNF